MDTKELEKFCPWARRELIDAVDLRCRRFALDPDGLAANPPSADVVAGRVLSPQEKAQRTQLAERIQASGYDAFCDQMAYTWFNRFAAIRFMEIHGYLPSYVRMFSNSEDGSFRPDSISCAADLDLPGLDKTEILNLMVKGDDEGVFRRVIVAQCNELAECLPEVFGQVDDADALTLPDGLLNSSEHSVLYHMVEDIPEEVWDNVEVLGWMYQFYNAELKDAFFKAKRKASAADIAPATQLFTPEWIVRYMVENSLGRLWMLNHPESHLRKRMEYYIEPDAEHEDFIHVESPEDITLCDPACGSGHILSYAFELLYAIYEECGYIAREIPELILTKNLSGYEIDPRAAQIASLVLALRAREHDRRFFRRDVRADVRVLESVPLEEGETGLPKKLAEELSHLGEIGSLLVPTDEDMDAIRTELVSRAGDLFAAATKDGLEGALETCEALRRHFDVVVANPPYMGSSSFNPFMSGWVKKNYPDVKSDLCTCFIERGHSLTADQGYTAMVTMQSWMFLGSFEKMRNKLIAEKGIVTMAHLGPRAFDAIGGEVVSVTADVLYNGKFEGSGAYFRLVDINGSEPKRQALLEAIKNPTCGWFYRRNASTFHQIPGSPIAYWVGNGLFAAFSTGIPLGDITDTHLGMATCDNNKYLRLWWEVASAKRVEPSQYPYVWSMTSWVPYNKGGIFRKWYGNDEYVVNWKNNGTVLCDAGAVMLSPTLRFRKMFSWTRVSSGSLAVRLKSAGYMFDMTGPAGFGPDDDLSYNCAFLNSAVGLQVARFLSASLDFQPGQIAKYPIIQDANLKPQVVELVTVLSTISKLDWDSLETSWDFKRHPLV